MVENNTDIDNRRVIWLDLDDTLWDFKANSRVALEGLYNDYDLKRWFATAAEWIGCYERHNHALWDQYNKALISKEYLMTERFRRPLQEAGSPLVSEYSRQFDGEYLDRLADCTRLIDGAIELLEAIRKRGYRTGILSNGFTEVQYRKIRNSGLEPYIDYVVLSDDIGVNKPDVRLFRYAEKVCGSDASRCLMIGDNPDTDIAGAIAAGWKAIYFSRKGDVHASVPTVRSLRLITDHAAFME